MKASACSESLWSVAAHLDAGGSTAITHAFLIHASGFNAGVLTIRADVERLRRNAPETEATDS